MWHSGFVMQRLTMRPAPLQTRFVYALQIKLQEMVLVMLFNT